MKKTNNKQKKFVNPDIYNGSFPTDIQKLRTYYHNSIDDIKISKNNDYHNDYINQLKEKSKQYINDYKNDLINNHNENKEKMREKYNNYKEKNIDRIKFENENFQRKWNILPAIKKNELIENMKKNPYIYSEYEIDIVMNDIKNNKDFDNQYNELSKIMIDDIDYMNNSHLFGDYDNDLNSIRENEKLINIIQNDYIPIYKDNEIVSSVSMDNIIDDIDYIYDNSEVEINESNE